MLSGVLEVIANGLEFWVGFDVNRTDIGISAIDVVRCSTDLAIKVRAEFHTKDACACDVNALKSKTKETIGVLSPFVKVELRHVLVACVEDC